MHATTISPFSLPNVRRFIAFRAFFNVRFYYPVFTIMFLDYGLTIEQFALLNTVWAFTIVLAEVPSGALADLIGRKRLLVSTSILMILEMLLLAFVPLGNSRLIFAAFLLNRILSGLAEALASGADEAMAYDTLVAKGNPEDWPRVLDIQMRVRYFFYVITMTSGALVYDPGVVNGVLHWLGSDLELSQQVTMRFPIYLTLGLGVLSLITTLGMHDPVIGESKQETASDIITRIKDVTRITLSAGSWITHTPMALAIILFGMSFDHILRLLVTMTSQYYRIIEMPDASFGLIGSGIAILGMVVPRIARAMVDHFSALVNLICLVTLGLLSLWGLTLCLPLFGVLPMVLVFITMMLTSFFISHYLNKIAEPKQRATILSYKGLAFNAAYGMVGILYATLFSDLRENLMQSSTALNTAQIEDAAFKLSLGYAPLYLFCTLIVVTGVCLIHFRVHRQKG
jgi:MFS family permease